MAKKQNKDWRPFHQLRLNTTEGLIEQEEPFPGSKKIGEELPDGSRWYRFRVTIGYENEEWHLHYIEVCAGNVSAALDGVKFLVMRDKLVSELKCILVPEGDRHETWHEGE